MLDSFINTAAEDVRFLLTSRPLDDGRTAIVLHLYRDERPAKTTTVSTVRQSTARMMLLLLRMHLFKLGLGEHAPRLPRAANLDLAREAA